MSSPKYAVLLLFIGITSSCAATNELITNPVPLTEEPIHITTITPQTYPLFLARFTEDCRPQTNNVVTAVAAAASLFNDKEYLRADFIFSRQVNDQILAFFNSKDCATEDLVIMLEESELITPLKYNILCMLRIEDSEADFARAGKVMEGETTDADIQASYDYMGLAIGALDEINTSRLCQYTSENLQYHITEVLTMYRELQEQLFVILEMDAYDP